MPCVLLMFVFAGRPHPVVADTASPAPEFREPDAAAEPRQLVGIAIYLLIAVTILSVSLLILLMLWGVRVRRQIRKPLPAVRPHDPLWYLKAEKHSRSEPQGPASVSDGNQPMPNPTDDSDSSSG